MLEQVALGIYYSWPCGQKMVRGPGKFLDTINRLRPVSIITVAKFKLLKYRKKNLKVFHYIVKLNYNIFFSINYKCNKRFSRGT